MSTVTQFSLAQYELMVESGAFDGKHRKRVEFIRGEIREMSPIGTRHAAAVDLLNRLSMDCLPSEKATIRIQGTLIVPTLESAPEPDVMWLVPKEYFECHPQPDDVLLLIEVADTSVSYDTGEKAKLYADAGIKDYWVVNVVDNCIDVFREPSASGYGQRHTCRADDEIQSLAFPEISIKPSTLFKK